MPPPAAVDPSHPGTYHNTEHVDHFAHHTSHVDHKIIKRTQPVGERASKVKEPKPPYHKPLQKKYGHHLNLSSDREYRHKALEERHEAERKAFEIRVKLLKDGYKSPLTLDNFTIDRTLGEGAFGRVVLAKIREDAPWDPSYDKFVAIKTMEKHQVLDEHQVEHTTNEKNLLFSLESRFLVKFYDYMIDRHNLFFVLKLAPLEMFGMLHRPPYNGKFSPEQAKHVSAQTVLAFDYLNNLEVVYRDIKPENMVITADGHMQLIDLGFAKRLCDKTHRTYTLCGTPEYIAPEVLANKGYGFSVDWWGIGVLMYELRAGKSPFESFSELDLYRKIRACQYKFPSDFSIPEKLIIGGLLQLDPHKRLGVGPGGPDTVMKHPYFKDVDFQALLAGTVPSPIKVSTKGEGDVSGFADDGNEDLRKPLKWTGAPKAGEYEGAFDHF